MHYDESVCFVLLDISNQMLTTHVIFIVASHLIT